MEAADRDNIGIEVRNSKKNKCNEIYPTVQKYGNGCGFFFITKRQLILEAADRDDNGIEVKNTKKNRCSKNVINNYSLLKKNPTQL